MHNMTARLLPGGGTAVPPSAALEAEHFYSDTFFYKTEEAEGERVKTVVG